MSYTSPVYGGAKLGDPAPAEVALFAHEIPKHPQPGNYLTWLAEQYASVEEDDIPVEYVLMNPSMYRTFRMATLDTFDPVTRRELIRCGRMGELWGALIILNRDVEEGTVQLYHAIDVAEGWEPPAMQDMRRA